MDILPGFKLCRKGLHQYPVDKKQCPECKKITDKAYRSLNKEKLKAQQTAWKEKNKNRVAIKIKEWKKRNQEKNKKAKHNWYQKNKHKCKSQNKQWVQNNKEKHASYQNKWRKDNRGLLKRYAKKWANKNKSYVNTQTAKRRALQKRAMPIWSNEKHIKEIYIQALLKTEQTGVQHQVDHIYPLISKFMCGLHVETNLQILTAEENASKGNRTWPGQLDCQKGSVYDIFPKELTDLLNDSKT